MIFILMTTHNGADTLPKMLNRLTQVIAPDGGWEMIAVNNGSTDNSGAILESYSQRLPIVIINEPRVGKNIALNRALDHLGNRAPKADLIVFCDDDILPDPDWLLRLAAVARRHPSADMFGGTIYASWTSPVPEWIRDFQPYFSTLFSVTEQGEGPCAANKLFGPNMAIRGSVLRSGVRFDPRIGPNGTNIYPMGSETEFAERLERSGHCAYFASKARVGHLIGDFQLTERAVYLRAYRAGLSYAWRAQAKPGRLHFAAISFRLLLSLIKACGITLSSFLARRRSGLRVGMFRINWHRGVFDGVMKRRVHRSALGRHVSVSD